MFILENLKIDIITLLNNFCTLFLTIFWILSIVFPNQNTFLQQSHAPSKTFQPPLFSIQSVHEWRVAFTTERYHVSDGTLIVVLKLLRLSLGHLKAYSGLKWIGGLKLQHCQRQKNSQATFSFCSRFLNEALVDALTDALIEALELIAEGSARTKWSSSLVVIEALLV